MALFRDFLLSFSSTLLKPNRTTRRRIFYFNLTNSSVVKNPNLTLIPNFPCNCNPNLVPNISIPDTNAHITLNLPNHNAISINNLFNANLNNLNITPNCPTKTNLISKKIYKRSFFKYDYNPNANLPNKNQVNKLSISLLNIRSLNNKSFYISDLITTHSPDFLALTETWHEDATSPSLVTATPLNYSFLELARPPTIPLSSSHSMYILWGLFILQIFIFSIKTFLFQIYFF